MHNKGGKTVRLAVAFPSAFSFLHDGSGVVDLLGDCVVGGRKYQDTTPAHKDTYTVTSAGLLKRHGLLFVPIPPSPSLLPPHPFAVVRSPSRVKDVVLPFHRLDSKKRSTVSSSHEL